MWGQYTFEDCVRRCAGFGVMAMKLEATQIISSYPYVSDEFWAKPPGKQNTACAHISYGANTDRGSVLTEI